MMLLPEDTPRYADGGIVDLVTGFSLDVPLGKQMPKAYWQENVAEYERVLARRKALGLPEIDDLLDDPIPVEMSGNDTKYTKPSRKRNSPAPRKRRTGAGKPMIRSLEGKNVTVLTTRERAAYLETKLAGGSNGPAWGASEKLNRYWTRGAGRARWANTGTPYRSLVAALRSEGVPGHMVNGLAARYYKIVKGVWPGKKGKKDSDDLMHLEQKLMAFHYEMETK